MIATCSIFITQRDGCNASGIGATFRFADSINENEDRLIRDWMAKLSCELYSNNGMVAQHKWLEWLYQQICRLAPLQSGRIFSSLSICRLCWSPKAQKCNDEGKHYISNGDCHGFISSGEVDSGDK